MPLKTISILGCGWLGLPLAKHLIQQYGWQVNGSTTASAKISLLENAGIRPFLIDGRPNLHGQNISSFFQSDVLFLNIPFKRNLINPSFYQEQIESVIQYILPSSIKFVIFASSTAVYPDNLELASEDKVFLADNPRGRVLLDIEKTLLSNNFFDATIIRFAGLYGPQRELGRFLAGKKELRNGFKPVNLIHLDDCIGIVSEVIQKNIRKQILNACSDKHPLRKELYAQAALKMGLTAPHFKDEPQKSYKIVTNEKIKRILHYQFKYSDPVLSLS